MTKLAKSKTIITSLSWHQDFIDCVDAFTKKLGLSRSTFIKLSLEWTLDNFEVFKKAIERRREASDYETRVRGVENKEERLRIIGEYVDSLKIRKEDFEE